MKKLIIFDCDGVLVDSEIIANRLDAEAFTAFGYPISTEESIRRFTGISVNGVQKMIFEDSGLLVPLELFTHLQNEIIQAFEKELTPLMQTLLEVLDHKKIDRCVASSSAKQRVIRSLELTEQLSFFNKSHIFSAQQVAHGKPAPDLFLLAGEEMGYNPLECVVIEDSPAGVEAALAANMRVIGFLGASHARYKWYRQRMEKYQIPLVDSSIDLLNCINELNNT